MARRSEFRPGRGSQVAVQLDDVYGQDVGVADEAGREGRSGPTVDLVRRPDLLDVALVEHDDPVGEGERLSLVVRDVDEGRSRLTMDAAQLGLHLEPDPQVERRERLVQQQHARPVDERTSERDALELAAGELMRRRRSNPTRRTSLSASVTRASMSGAPLTRSPNATFSKTSRCGKSAARWKTMFTGRRWGGMRVTSRPCSSSRPSVGRMNPATIRSSVVFPQPDGPSSVTNSPSEIVSETSWRAVTVP